MSVLQLTTYIHAYTDRIYTHVSVSAFSLRKRCILPRAMSSGRDIYHEANLRQQFTCRSSATLQPSSSTHCLRPSSTGYHRRCSTMGDKHFHRNEHAAVLVRGSLALRITLILTTTALLLGGCPAALAAPSAQQSAELCFLSHGGSSETFTVNEAMPVNSIIGTLKVSSHFVNLVKPTHTNDT